MPPLPEHSCDSGAKISYIEKLPEHHDVSGDLTVLRFRFDQEIGFEEKLQEAGFSIGEKIAVINALAAIELIKSRWTTIGEVREMSDEQLMQSGKLGPKRVQMLRKLFGRKELD